MKKILFLVLTVTLFGCDSKPVDKIEDLRSTIVQVNGESKYNDGHSLVIDVKSDSVWENASEGWSIFKGIKKNFPQELDKYDSVWLISNSRLVDEYNNQFVDRTLALEWSIKDIKKMNFEGFEVFALLNLATKAESFIPAGTDQLLGHCMDNEQLRYSQQFCTMYVRNKLAKQ